MEDVLRDFVDKVDARLTANGITDSWLQTEWAAVRQAEVDPEQRRFCRAAAWLGLDPFDLDEIQSRNIEALANELPADLVEDALRAADPASPESVAEWIKQQLALRSSPSGTTAELIRIRSETQSATNGSPWEIGYALARHVHRMRPELVRAPAPIEGLFDGDLPVVQANEMPGSVEGLVLAEYGFECRTAKRQPEALRFLVARAVYDFIRLDSHKSLLTGARTTRQSQGRAFAAELLAPANALRERLTTETATPEQVSDLAAEFQVSYYVVQHQIQNHRLAKIPT